METIFLLDAPHSLARSSELRFCLFYLLSNTIQRWPFSESLILTHSTIEEDNFLKTRFFISLSASRLLNEIYGMCWKRFLLQATMAVIIHNLSCIKSNIWQHYQNTAVYFMLATSAYICANTARERGLVAGNKCIS